MVVEFSIMDKICGNCVNWRGIGLMQPDGEAPRITRPRCQHYAISWWRWKWICLVILWRNHVWSSWYGTCEYWQQRGGRIDNG